MPAFDVSIYDEPSTNQSLLQDTFKVYQTIVSADGTLTKGAELTQDGNYTLDFQSDATKDSFTLEFINPIDQAYILEYQSFIMAADKDTLTNDVTLSATEPNLPSDTGSESSVEVRVTTGSGTGTGETGTLNIHKTDATGNTALAGADFELYDSTGLIKLKEGTTDADGNLTFYRLLYGDYLLKEVGAPEGYVLNSTPTAVTLGSESPILNIQNDAIVRDVELTKIDGTTGEALENALYVIQSTDGTYNRTKYTDANGKINITDLEPGSYEFLEIGAPSGYLINTTPIPFEITENQTEPIELTAENELIPGSVELTKVDEADDSLTLAGGVFKLVDSDGTTVQENLTTDSDGKITVSDLRPGDYSFIETSAPSGYVLDSTPVPFTINRSQASTLTVTAEDEKTSVTLSKAALDEEPLLPDATFEIYDSQNTLVKTVTTGDDGQVVVEGLPVGTYTFKEISAPSGYFINTTDTPSFTINEDGSLSDDSVTTITNEKTSVTLSKTDSDTGSLVAGATFEIYDTQNTLVKTVTTGDNGKVVVEGLPIGTYTFKETGAPNGYVMNTTDTPSFTINPDGSLTEGSITNISDEKTSVTLSKADATTSEGVAGAQITIYNEDGTMVSQTTTDADGNTTIEGLWVGTYTFKETVAPEGYIINTEIFEFTINEDGTVTGDNTVTDEKTSVTLTKADATTAEGVAGAQITIYNEEGDIVSETITGDDGNTTIEGLPVGTYTFKETVAPEGYIINTEIFEFTINEDGSVTGDNTVTDEKTSVTLTKADATTAEGVAGAQITIYNEDGDIVSETITGDDGNTTIEGLPVGTYTFKETVAPEGYIINTEIFEFTINEDGSVDGDNTVTDEKTSVTLTKIDSDTELWVAGAEIAIYDENGEMVSQTITGDNGNTTIEGLPVGVYTFKEITAPSGYALNLDTFSFEIKADGSITGDTTLPDKKTIVTLTKTDTATGIGLPGSEIAIYDASGEMVSQTITDADGNTTIIGLPAGDYTFEELTPPIGYSRSTETYAFTINPDGSTTGDLGLTDSQTVVTLTKADTTTAEGIPGAQITIYDEEGNIVSQTTTDADGNTTIIGLTIGTYTFEETVAPDGYIINKTIFEFTINPDGTIDGDTTVTDEKTSVTLMKLDSQTSTGLTGAEFTIYNQDGEIVSVTTTELMGKTTIEGLPVGTYTFKETGVPEGYTGSTQTYSFTIAEDGTITGDTIVMNDPIIVTNPNTGVDANASGFLVGLVLLSLSVLGVNQKRRKLQ